MLNYSAGSMLHTVTLSYNYYSVVSCGCGVGIHYTLFNSKVNGMGTLNFANANMIYNKHLRSSYSFYFTPPHFNVVNVKSFVI